MHTYEGNVGAVNGTAHVEAASHGDLQMRWQVIAFEVVIEGIHNNLNGTGSVGSSAVAVYPALGVEHGAQGATSTTNREAVSFYFFDDLVNVFFFGGHELDRGTSREAKMTVAVFVCEGSKPTNGFGGEQTGGTYTYGVESTGRTNVFENTWFYFFMILPLKIVVLAHLRHFIPVVRRSNISCSVLRHHYSATSVLSRSSPYQ